MASQWQLNQFFLMNVQYFPLRYQWQSCELDPISSQGAYRLNARSEACGQLPIYTFFVLRNQLILSIVDKLQCATKRCQKPPMTLESHNSSCCRKTLIKCHKWFVTPLCSMLPLIILEVKTVDQSEHL